MRNRKNLAPLLALLLFVGCTKQPATVHPGTFNQFDSNAYTTLLDAQATLQGAQANIANGKWPAAWNEYINEAGNFYNIAMNSYNAYHNTLAGLQTGDINALQTQLQFSLNNLTDSIKKMVEKTGGVK